jgi:hypothetical protein
LYLARGRPSTRILFTAAAAIWLSLTVVPWFLVAVFVPLLVLGPVAIAFRGREDHPWVFVSVVAIILMGGPCLNRFGVDLVGMRLFTLFFAAAAFMKERDNPPARFALGGLTLWGILELFISPEIIVTSAVFAGLSAGLVYLFGWRTRPIIEGVALWVFLAFEVFAVYGGRGDVLRVAALAPFAGALVKRSAIQPWASRLPTVAAVGVVLSASYFQRNESWLFNNVGHNWLFLYKYVPGVPAMMFVSRGGLLLLVVWGLGIAYALDAVSRSHRPSLALALGAIVLLEQGVTTDSFDKAENRARISNLAARIGGEVETFYYTPHDAPRRWPTAHLDAMWAGLEHGTPTINGYSGSTPIKWRGLEDSTVNDMEDVLRLEAALEEWRRGPGRSVGPVIWLDGSQHRTVPSAAELPEPIEEDEPSFSEAP